MYLRRTHLNKVQHQIGLWGSAMALAAALLFCGVEFFQEAPQTRLLLLGVMAVVLTALLLVAYIRNWHSHARCMILFLGSLVVGFGMPEPYLSVTPSLAVFVVPAMGIVAGNGLSVFVCFAFQLFILAARAEWQGPYTDPGTFVLLALTITAIVMGRVAMDLSLREAEQRTKEIQHYVTERERSLELQRELQCRLFESQKMETVGRLAGGIAHDFNNLLTIIRLATEGARPIARGNAELEFNLTAISSASERGAKVVRQLLAFARKQVIVPAQLNLNCLLADLEKMGSPTESVGEKRRSVSRRGKVGANRCCVPPETSIVPVI